MINGSLYISVPISEKNHISFNAHREFREDYLLNLFDPYEVVQKRYIYGKSFFLEKRTGSGTGCYQIRRGSA
jgi:hypothetical protein